MAESSCVAIWDNTNVKKTTIFDFVGNIAPPSTLLLAKIGKASTCHTEKRKAKKNRKRR
jgi:hypothetical protein